MIISIPSCCLQLATKEDPLIDVESFECTSHTFFSTQLIQQSLVPVTYTKQGNLVGIVQRDCHFFCLGGESFENNFNKVKYHLHEHKVSPRRGGLFLAELAERALYTFFGGALFLEKYIHIKPHQDCTTASTEH